MADIFISYASEDRDRVIPIVKALEEQGWSTFWDWKSIPVGKTWREVIDEALEAARCVLVLWSTNSTNKRRRWVLEEADYGLEHAKLIPALIDDVRPPRGFGQIQAAKLINWTGDTNHPEFKKLADALESILGPSPRQVRESERAAETERKRKQEEERKRKEEEQRKAEEESQRLREEERRKAEEKRRFDEEQKRAEAERKAEEERNRKEIEKKRQAEEERKRKEAEVEAERARKAQVERKAETPKPEPKEPRPAETPVEEAKLFEPGPSKPKPDIKKPGEKSPATKIGILIALAVMIGAGAILFFQQEPTRSRPEISAPQAKPAEPPVAARPSESSPSKKFTNSIGMEFVLITAGSFKMGSNAGDADEEPPHEVRISQSFYLQETEVTQGQWKKVMGDNPSEFKQCGDDCPVESVSWDDAKRFIEKLNQLEKTKAYRLPSEAEWEYACRAGTNTEYFFGNDESKLRDYAWYSVDSIDTTQRVAGKKPNSWGLYDMHGNVWEWVEDDYHGSYKGAPGDGSAWIDTPRGSNRVVRGGGWDYGARYCRSAVREYGRPDIRNVSVGFRLSRSVALGP